MPTADEKRAMSWIDEYARGSKTDIISGRMLFEMLRQLHKCNLNENEEKIFIKKVLRWGIWFENNTEAINRYPFDRLSQGTRAKFAKGVILEILEPVRSCVTLYDGKLIISSEHPLKYYHMGGMRIHPIPSTCSDICTNLIDIDECKRGFEHVLMLRSPFADNATNNLEFKYILLYMIGWLKDGRHIISAKCAGWCPGGFMDILRLISASNIAGITEITEFAPQIFKNNVLNESSEVGCIFKKLMEIEYLELFTPLSSKLITIKFLEFIKTVNPKNIRLVIGVGMHGMVLDILDNVPLDTHICDLAVEKIGQFLDTTIQSSGSRGIERLENCEQIRGISFVAAGDSEIRAFKLDRWCNLYRRLSFLHIRSIDCTDHMLNVLQSSNIETLILDFRGVKTAVPRSGAPRVAMSNGAVSISHTPVMAYNDMRLLSSALAMQKLRTLMVICSTEDEHRLAVKKSTEALEMDEHQKKVVILRKRPHQTAKTHLEKLLNKEKTKYIYEEIAPEERHYITFVNLNENYKD